MDRLQKFLHKLTPKLRARIIEAVAAITENRLENLDVRPLTGKKGWFRCRVGDIRIIFVHTDSGTNVVLEAEFRGRIYRHL